ncbi:hypothetical protein Ddye_007008 [Dipteronia dyeriana]|uniref:Uncharacterized protein n=1 Tax=Dipteronia dyeriana TaxID=168575 RepID=A0AAE0CR29_9ROSI|nr:hypothetical protein Ddye_007008 [Dipteronia dyeriana]
MLACLAVIAQISRSQLNICIVLIILLNEKEGSLIFSYPQPQDLSLALKTAIRQPEKSMKLIVQPLQEVWLIKQTLGRKQTTGTLVHRQVPILETWPYHPTATQQQFEMGNRRQLAE